MSDRIVNIVGVGNTLMGAAEELTNLVEASFGGAEAEAVLERIGGLGEEEWKADRMRRKLSRRIYQLEDQLDPVTILLYDKILETLSAVANAAENTGELLRAMIVKG